MLSAIFATALLALGVNAGTSHSIDVGKGGLKFTPDSTTAAIGDTLEFHFYSGTGSHSVVEGIFSSPCKPATNAFFSGYIPGSTEGEMTFVVNVTSTDPIWLYCSLGSHCSLGMVGVVNPPADQTVAQYAAAAKGASADAPASVTGGSVTTISESADSSTSAPATTAPSGSAATVSATTTTGSGSATATPSSTATATTTPSSAGRGAELSVMLGLTIVLGGLVALMA